MLSKYFVRDVMVRGIYEIRLNDSVLDAIKIMGKNDISSVVVSDDNGTYWGIITELDILKNHSNIDKVKAKEIMSTNLTTISPTAPLERAASLMPEKKIHHLYHHFFFGFFKNILRKVSILVLMDVPFRQIIIFNI